MPHLPALTLQSFAGEARALRLDQFRERFGDAFLLRSGTSKPSPGQLKTVAALPAESAIFALGDSSVFMMKEARPPVTLGRARSSDVVLGDTSISSFHAGLVKDGDRWAAHDGRSRNGTFVDGKPAPARGDGPPAPLVVGKILRLGSVELLFADAALVAQLARIDADEGP